MLDNNLFPPEYLLCRQCGLEIAKASDLNKRPSRAAHRQRNDTIAGVDGVLIQLFKNPQGYTQNFFEVITAETANVQQHGQPYRQDTWWPGFSWRISICPRCGFHLGWYVEKCSLVSSPSVQAEEQTFVGLILDNLLYQKYADNLLVVPKSYRS
uniref:CULT domain-containing protein n=1 Tax=Branchiostoma floridae TaxID=7739 RepID=C3ZQP4_BRAFL|eukprot:XP_002589079.1 hypothetical protein BRAFLDRAFT_213715 [Branchiostoma floridae]